MNIYKKPDYIPNHFISVANKKLRHRIAAHGHDFFEIEFFVHGKGIHIIDKKEYPIVANSLFLLSPASVHSIETDCAEVITVMFQCECDGDFFTFPNQDPACSPAFYLNEEQAKLLCPLLEELLAFYIDEPRYAILLLQCILHKLNLLTAFKNPPSLPLVQNAMIYMMEHFREKLTLESLAEHFGYSSAYFSELFYQQTGIHFKTYLDNIRFSHAQNLLTFSTLPINEIFLRAGFGDYTNFVRRFKQRFDMTPSEYRNKKMLR